MHEEIYEWKREWSQSRRFCVALLALVRRLMFECLIVKDFRRIAREATISFITSVRPQEAFGSNWTDFNEIDTWVFFGKLLKKFKFHWNLTK